MCTGQPPQPPTAEAAPKPRVRTGASTQPGRLTARPGVPSPSGPKPGGPASGVLPLGLGSGGRDGLLYVPSGYRPERPAPLLLLLHGAGGNARVAVSSFREEADRRGMILLAPESRQRTWDLIVDGAYGPDAALVDRALAETFGRYAVDPARVAASGFSDGASYALSLGLANGDLFPRVIAFSPGYVVPGARTGSPRIFISHGTADEILPIDRCSRRIVPELRRAGLDVTYREFDGPHGVPMEIAVEALDWFLK